MFYAKITTPLRNAPHGPGVLAHIDRVLVGIIAGSYGAVLLWLMTTGDERFGRIFLVPGISLILVSIMRILINAPRPYEKYVIDPLIKKTTHGKSFPGRHTFSAGIIACALFWLNPLWGALAFCGTGLIAITRILGGVHFPRDIGGAIILALICGYVGFILIP